MPTMMLMVVLLCTCLMAHGAVRTEMVDYRSGGTALQGYLAYDDQGEGRQPGVLVIHEWWGLNDYPKERARQLAQMGYVAFAADMYGKGVVAKDRDEAGKLAGQFRAQWESGGRELMRERARAGLAVLARQPRVDPTRLAAIGYCFGGTAALELAYSGAELAAVVSFHGGLTAPREADLPNLKPSFLILHGAADTSVKPEDVAALQQGLEQAGADWQMVIYSGAKHGFTNPSNTAAYQERAARRSWEAMQSLFQAVLKAP